MTYQDAMTILPRTDRDRAAMYSINSLLQQKGLYTSHEFEAGVIEWARMHYRGMNVAHADFIADQVAMHFGIERANLKNKGNAAPVVLPRQVGIYLMRALTEWSLPEIGKYYGKHHTTVLHSVEVIAARRQVNEQVDRMIAKISDSFHEQFSNLD